MATKFLVLVPLLCMTACSSINTIKNPDPDSADGLTYFMPKKDFIVTVTVDDKGKQSIVFGTTGAYPDLSNQYVLHYSRNLLGKNELDVQVTTSGLLTDKALSKTTNQLSEFLRAIGAVAAPSASAKAAGPICEPSSTYKAVLPAEETAEGKSIAVCNYNITVRKHSVANRSDGLPIAGSTKVNRESNSGIFYRRDEPYLITAIPKDNPDRGSKVTVFQEVRFSPSQSETHFLPIERTLFSNNEATFTLEDGMLKQYKQSADGELIGLVKLPSEVIKAYFGAMGSFFDALKTRDQKEAGLMTEALKLELTKKKFDACLAAIKAGDDKLLASLGCGN